MAVPSWWTPTFAPLPVFLVAVPVPLKNSPLKSGTLNVVLPSPAPYKSPIAEYKSAYSVLDTSLPSHIKYPSGVFWPPNDIIVPAGVESVFPINSVVPISPVTGSILQFVSFTVTFNSDILLHAQ